MGGGGGGGGGREERGPRDFGLFKGCCEGVKGFFFEAGGGGGGGSKANSTGNLALLRGVRVLGSEGSTFWGLTLVGLQV